MPEAALEQSESEAYKRDYPYCLIINHLLRLVRSPPESREDAVGPVISGDVQSTKHLRSRDSFRIHSHLLVWFTTLGHGLHQHSDALRLAGSRRSEGHHTVTYTLRLIELDQLQYPRRMMYQAKLVHLQSKHVTHTSPV